MSHELHINIYSLYLQQLNKITNIDNVECKNHNNNFDASVGATEVMRQLKFFCGGCFLILCPLLI